MPYAPFNERFPEIAKKETRVISTINDPELPKGDYVLVEAYCDEKGCDCRRVFLNVFSGARKEFVAVIAYGWESYTFYKKWLGYDDASAINELKGPALNTASYQSEIAPILLDRVIRYVLNNDLYITRIQRHYRMFKDSVKKERKTRLTNTVAKVKIGRNDPCPCGSGKKYKRCCTNKR